MLGTLTPEQCRFILLQNHVGRIGCSSERKVLIIPVTYVFDGDYIYGYSLNGEKVDMMRKNTNVCFEVDTIENLANWRSVIVNGEYEELNNDATDRKIRRLFEDRLGPLVKGETLHPSRELADPPRRILKNQKPVLYRIKIKSLSGRFEKPS